jgi:hypothetical protein
MYSLSYFWPTMSVSSFVKLGMFLVSGQHTFLTIGI